MMLFDHTTSTLVGVFLLSFLTIFFVAITVAYCSTKIYFDMKAILLCMLSFMLLQTSCGQSNNQQTKRNTSSSVRVGGPCEGCELIYTNMPQQMNAVDTSIGWNQEGQRMKIEGTVFRKDGKTPATGIIVYYYQTNTAGEYGKTASESTRHGSIRGWMKTGADGRYTIYTIKPGSYPGSTIPAHMHVLIKEPGINEYYIDDINFDDDPFLTKKEKDRMGKLAGTGVITLIKNSEGLLYGNRDIILGLHIQNYPQ